MKEKNSKKTKELEKEKIIIIEGPDDESFLQILMKKISLKVDFLPIKGKNLPTVLDVISKSLNIKKVGIMLDADKSREKTIEKLKLSLEKFDFPVPETELKIKTKGKKSVVFVITPHEGNRGNLETIFLENVKSSYTEMFDCIENYLSCIKKYDPTKFTNLNLDKVKCKILLSSLQESVGVGNARKFWNLNHPSLKPFYEFLDLILTDNTVS